MTNGNEQLYDRVQEGLATFNSVVEERDRAIKAAVQWERDFQRVYSENEFYRNQVVQLEAKLDYYMRHSVELTTQMNAAIAVISDGLAKARQGASRPNGAAVVAELEKAIAADPAPAFLTKRIEDE